MNSQSKLTVRIKVISKTNYTEEMPTGIVEIESLESLASEVGGEVVGNSIICEWGNGEGYDEYQVEILGGESGADAP